MKVILTNDYEMFREGVVIDIEIGEFDGFSVPVLVTLEHKESGEELTLEMSSSLSLDRDFRSVEIDFTSLDAQDLGDVESLFRRTIQNTLRQIGTVSLGEHPPEDFYRVILDLDFGGGRSIELSCDLPRDNPEVQIYIQSMEDHENGE